MNKEFIPYEQALVLKELGFDEPCFGYYKENQYELNKEFHCYNSDYVEHLGVYIAAPLYQQAFRFFKEKYKLQVYIDFYHSESYFFKIKSQDGRYIGNTGDIILQGSPVFTRTYEEAELHCLKKLIEIVKHKNNYGTSKQSL